MISKIRNINPNKYKSVTNPPQLIRLGKQFIISSNKPQDGFSSTNSKFKFNTNTLEWKKTHSNIYVRNTKNYRPNNPSTKNVPKRIQLLDTLYGYNHKRNNWVGKNILTNSAQIPFVGLKNTTIKLLK